MDDIVCSQTFVFELLRMFDLNIRCQQDVYLLYSICGSVLISKCKFLNDTTCFPPSVLCDSLKSLKSTNAQHLYQYLFDPFLNQTLENED